MKSFSIGITIRITILVAQAILMAHFWNANQLSIVFALLLMMIFVSFNLYSYTTTLNKKLSRIFDSIQYQDFAITFRADNGKGESFEQLNNSLNAVIKSFNQIRSEREASLHFIQAIIQQINVGILSYNNEGKIELINQSANKVLNIYNLLHISSIKNQHPEIYDTITALPSGESKLIKLNNDEISISVKEIVLRDRKIRLIALHNLRSELQTRELEAWQNLTKVLRHEILNSVTPIVSLAETMKNIIDFDLVDVEKDNHKEGIKDLNQAVKTVIHRSKGIMNFVNAYREFTAVPVPQLRETKVTDLFHDVQTLYETKGGIDVDFEIKNDFIMICDSDLIQQVLINLIKNSIEAVECKSNPKITVVAFVKDQIKIIAVIDNGPGVLEDDADKIFVPFFTTKANGSGIGLSLSRQIMLMHNGSLEYRKGEQSGSVFLIKF